MQLQFWTTNFEIFVAKLNDIFNLKHMTPTMIFFSACPIESELGYVLNEIALCTYLNKESFCLYLYETILGM